MPSQLRLVADHEMVSLEPNSVLSDSSSATLLLNMVCPGLVRLDANLEVEPGLSTEWTVSEDYRVFRFKLRSGLRFHSGRPVTAEAIVWNFRRLFDSRSRSPLAADYVDLSEVREAGSRVVEFEFHHPFPAFLHHLAWRTYITEDSLIQPVGAGPFELVDWERGRSIRLRRFGAKRDPDLFDEVVVTWAPSSEARIETVESGQFDVLESAPTTSAASDLVAGGLLEIDRVRASNRTVLAFNCAKPPFDDPRVRRAVALAIDRSEILRSVFGGNASPVGSALPQGDPWAGETEAAPQDLRLARELMQAAGLSQPISVQAVTAAVGALPAVAERVAGMLRDVGIQATFSFYDDPPWWPYIYLGADWNMAVQGWSARPDPDILFSREYHSSGAFNATRYQNAVVDQLTVDARRQVSATERHALYGKLQTILADDWPVLPLCSTDIVVGWRPGLKGVRAHPLGALRLEQVSGAPTA